MGSRLLRGLVLRSHARVEQKRGQIEASEQQERRTATEPGGSARDTRLLPGSAAANRKAPRKYRNAQPN